MKTRTILLALLCSCATTTGFAQLRLGGKIGMNVATLKGSYGTGEAAKQKIGFHAGLRAEYPLGEASKLALAGELLFSTQGLITDSSNLQNDGNGNFSYRETRNTYSLNYINLPVFLKYQVLEQLSIEGGPQFGYAISGEIKTEITNTENPAQNQTYTQDALKAGYRLNGTTLQAYPKTIKPLDIGLNFGATYDFSDKVFAQLHYYFGLNDIDARTPASYSPSNPNYFFTTQTYTLRSSVFQVSLGYRFM